MADNDILNENSRMTQNSDGTYSVAGMRFDSNNINLNQFKTKELQKQRLAYLQSVAQLDPSSLSIEEFKKIREDLEAYDVLVNKKNIYSNDRVKDLSTTSPMAYGLYRNINEYDNSYDDHIHDIEKLDEGYSIENLRAEEQSTASKWLNGFVKMGVKTAESFAGLGASILSGAYALSTLDANNFAKSPVFEAINWVDEQAERLFPNYKTKEETENPWYKNMGTANFWADSVIKNLGYTMGAAAAGKTGINILANLDMLKSGAAARWIGSLMGAIGEGGLEASMAYKEAKDDALRGIQGINRQLNDLIDSLYQLIRALYGLEYADLWRTTQSGLAYNEMTLALDLAEKLAAAIGTGTFVANVVLLTLTDNLLLGKYYSLGFDTAKRQAIKQGIKPTSGNIWNMYNKLENTAKIALRIVDSEGKYVFKNIPKYKSILKGIGTGLSEGNEEMAQAFISETDKAMHMHDNPLAYYQAINDPTMRGKTKDFLQSTSVGLAKSYFDINRYEEGFVGFLTGIFGVPTFGKTNNNSSSTYLGKGKSIGLTGGLFGLISERERTNKEGNELVSNMNSFKDKAKNMTNSLIGSMAFLDLQDGWANTNNRFEWNNANDNFWATNFSTYLRAGRKSDFIKFVVDKYDNMSELELNTIAANNRNQWSEPYGKDGGTRLMSETPEGRNKMREKLELNKDDLIDSFNEYEKSFDYINDITGNMDQLLKDHLIWLHWKGHMFNKRFNSILGVNGIEDNGIKKGLEATQSFFNGLLSVIQDKLDKILFDLDKGGLSEEERNRKQLLKRALQATVNLYDYVSKGLDFLVNLKDVPLGNGNAYRAIDLLGNFMKDEKNYHLFDAIKDLRKNNDALKEDSPLWDNLDDIRKLAILNQQFKDTLKKYLENPHLIVEELNAVNATNQAEEELIEGVESKKILNGSFYEILQHFSNGDIKFDEIKALAAASEHPNAERFLDVYELYEFLKRIANTKYDRNTDIGRVTANSHYSLLKKTALLYLWEQDLVENFKNNITDSEFNDCFSGVNNYATNKGLNVDETVDKVREDIANAVNNTNRTRNIPTLNLRTVINDPDVYLNNATYANEAVRSKQALKSFAEKVKSEIIGIQEENLTPELEEDINKTLAYLYYTYKTYMKESPSTAETKIKKLLKDELFTTFSSLIDEVNNNSIGFRALSQLALANDIKEELEADIKLEEENGTDNANMLFDDDDELDLYSAAMMLLDDAEEINISFSGIADVKNEVEEHLKEQLKSDGTFRRGTSLYIYRILSKTQEGVKTTKYIIRQKPYERYKPVPGEDGKIAYYYDQYRYIKNKKGEYVHEKKDVSYVELIKRKWEALQEEKAFDNIERFKHLNENGSKKRVKFVISKKFNDNISFGDFKNIQILIADEDDHGGYHILCDLMNSQNKKYSLYNSLGNNNTKPVLKDLAAIESMILEKYKNDTNKHEGGVDIWDSGFTTTFDRVIDGEIPWTMETYTKNGIARKPELNSVWNIMRASKDSDDVEADIKFGYVSRNKADNEPLISVSYDAASGSSSPKSESIDNILNIKKDNLYPGAPVLLYKMKSGKYIPIPLVSRLLKDLSLSNSDYEYFNDLFDKKILDIYNELNNHIVGTNPQDLMGLVLRELKSVLVISQATVDLKHTYKTNAKNGEHLAGLTITKPVRIFGMSLENGQLIIREKPANSPYRDSKKNGRETASSLKTRRKIRERFIDDKSVKLEIVTSQLDTTTDGKFVKILKTTIDLKSVGLQDFIKIMRDYFSNFYIKLDKTKLQSYSEFLNLDEFDAYKNTEKYEYIKAMSKIFQANIEKFSPTPVNNHYAISTKDIKEGSVSITLPSAESAIPNNPSLSSSNNSNSQTNTTLTLTTLTLQNQLLQQLNIALTLQNEDEILQKIKKNKSDYNRIQAIIRRLNPNLVKQTDSIIKKILTNQPVNNINSIAKASILSILKTYITNNNVSFLLEDINLNSFNNIKLFIEEYLLTDISNSSFESFYNAIKVLFDNSIDETISNHYKSNDIENYYNLMNDFYKYINFDLLTNNLAINDLLYNIKEEFDAINKYGYILTNEYQKRGNKKIDLTNNKQIKSFIFAKYSLDNISLDMKEYLNLLGISEQEYDDMSIEEKEFLFKCNF